MYKHRATSPESNSSGPFEFGTFVDHIVERSKKKASASNEADEISKWMLADGLTRAEVTLRNPLYANTYRFLLDQLEKMVAAGQRKTAKTVTKRTKVVAIQGEPGTGKSSTIRELVRAEDMYTVSPGNTGFCCGFADESVILFEEVNDTTLDLGTFKTLAECTGDAVLKRKHKDAMPFNSELSVMITNH